MPFFESGDIRFHFESCGRGDPVLLIHGLGSSSRDWENQTGVLTERYRVIIPDLRGHGESDKPPGPYSIPLFAGDLVSLLRSLDIAPIHVVGLSLGGFVAFQLAVEHPDLVRSLIVVNTAPGLPRDRIRDRMRIAWALFLRRLIVRLFGMRMLGRFVIRKLFPRPSQSTLKARFIERWANNQPDAYLASLEAISRWNIEDQVGSISCPTCVISGEHDFLPLELKERYTKELANGELKVIPASGHFTPVDAPEKFNKTLMSFLAKHG